ncbi:MAG: divergent polysaccharide deacetylase family protein [Methylocystis sp.]|nr:divergent polysaccharide deacetylase family protein [Methylocystis sp.]
MTDELNEPLGLGEPPRDARRPRFSWNGLVIAGLTLIAAGVATVSFLPSDPFSGEPHAVARIEMAKPPAPPPASETARNVVAERQDAGDANALPAQRVASANEIEQGSGVKITRSGSPDAPGALIIQLDRPVDLRLAPAPDQRLLEKSRHGLLPKIGADGARPMDIYARPVSLSTKLKAGAPRIALVVGGVGLNPSLAGNAIEELPGAVSLAFAPYGQNLAALAARAREHGHEILLQAPMEPFDYPQNDPGPHTLLTGAQNGADLDDLHWLMSRFAGYVGVVNFLGARFTADEKALSPALADIAARGLFFLDDGTSQQSLVAGLAPRLMLPLARADVVVDAREAPEAIDAALARLESLARQKGAAIGFASALPRTVPRLARFARDLERRGVALVPVTAMVTTPSPLETRVGSQQ